MTPRSSAAFKGSPSGLVGAETRPQMKNDFANWKPKRSENWFRNFSSGTFRPSSAAVLAATSSFVCTYGTCNRFLNANKCHQSIFIIMASWLITLDLFSNKWAVKWKALKTIRPTRCLVMNGGGRIRCMLGALWRQSGASAAVGTRKCNWNVLIATSAAQFVVHCSQMQRQRCNKFPIKCSSLTRNSPPTSDHSRSLNQSQWAIMGCL